MGKLIFKNRLQLLALLIVFLNGFSSCNIDEEDTIAPKTTEEYRQELISFVTSEKAVVINCVIGYDKGNFKVAATANFASYKNAYLTVLNAAELVANKSNVTIAEIVAAQKTFAKPGENFFINLFISDRRQLNDLIVPCEALNTTTLVGTTTSKVPQEAKTTFTAAIAVAKTVRDASTTIDRQVVDAVKILGDAKKAFEAAIIK